MEGGECEEDSQADSTGDAEENLHAVEKKATTSDLNISKE